MVKIDVSFHEETYDAYFKPLESSHPGFLETLLADFKRYQGSQREELPAYFGYDAEYGYPPEIAGCLEHIHLCIPPNKFPKNYRQIDRRCKIGNPSKDVALVYARNLYEPSFKIIAILHPDAHSQAKNMKLMRHLGHLGREFKNALL